MQIALIVIVAFLVLGAEQKAGTGKATSSRPLPPSRPISTQSVVDQILGGAGSALGSFFKSRSSGSGSGGFGDPPPGSFGTATDTADLDTFDSKALDSEWNADDGLAFHDD